MKITIVHEHSVALDLLRKEGSNILDLGCRTCEFTKYFDALGHFVVPVDIDSTILTDRPYLNMAVTNYKGTCGIRRSQDAQATKMSRVLTDELVNCTTIEGISDSFKIPYWDLIKIDVEGAEYEIIMGLTKAPAKQISWEAHLHTGAYSMQEGRQMELKLLSLGYKAIKHELTEAHGAGKNYWDSLFIHE